MASQVTLSQRREHLVGRLRVRKTRARENTVLVEGVRASTEALDSGASVAFAIISSRLSASKSGKDLEKRLNEVEVIVVEDRKLEQISDTAQSQGVMLVCIEPSADLDLVQSPGRHMVLDGLQDPGNTGTLIRSAVAFGLDSVICLDGTVDPWLPKAVRASAGMIFQIPVVRADTQKFLSHLSHIKIPLYVAEVGGQDIATCNVPTSFALALGNEGIGIRPMLGHAAKDMLAVSMQGPADSLNVAMAGSILLYGMTRGET